MSRKSIQKILIIRFSSIGDIVLTTPVIRCLKKKYPEASLHFLTKKQYKDCVVHNPYIDIVHLLENDLNENIAILQKEKFDVIVDLHHNLRSLKVKNALKVKRTFTFPKLNVRKWLYVNTKWNTLPDQSIVDRYFSAVSPIDVRNDGEGLDFFIPEKESTRKEDIPMGHWMGYVACIIGGTYFTKQFPAEKWIALIEKLEYPVILAGGPSDKAMATIIQASNPDKIYNSCGKFSLLESADLVKKAKVVVTNDTGLMHIGAAFKKPMVTLWGNTTPWLGMYPYYGANNLTGTVSTTFSIIENNDISCRPCSKIGFDHCPKKHFKCMNDLDVATIAQDVIKYWKGN